MPREKLAKFGAAHLTDLELLRLLIGSGNKQASAEQIARRILKLLRDKGSSITYEEISRIQGMGPAKTSEIIALFELGKRYLMPADRPKIENAETAVEAETAATAESAAKADFATRSGQVDNLAGNYADIVFSYSTQGTLLVRTTKDSRWTKLTGSVV